MTATRRHLLTSLLLSPTLLRAASDDLPAAWAALERRAGGRLGVALLDTGSGQTWQHRGDAFFGLCSTFKLPLAAAALAGIDAGRWQGDELLPLGDLSRVGHAPVTQGKARMALLQLAQAAQQQSDNGAANALLRRLGGPAAFTQWLREQGDAKTRVERYEPEMNRVLPGEERDSTTPLAMAALTARLCVGESLKPASRARLIAWMEATRTGKQRLRAGLPKGWRAGDKTGTGFSEGLPDRLNDVAIFWPPGKPPLTLACYYEGPKQSSEWIRPEDEAVLAEVARLATQG
jgi:beta-lactamase class A